MSCTTTATATTTTCVVLTFAVAALLQRVDVAHYHASATFGDRRLTTHGAETHTNTHTSERLETAVPDLRAETRKRSRETINGGVVAHTLLH